MRHIHAVQLREDGLTIQAIADELGIPRSTAGDLVVGIEPLPVLVDEAVVDEAEEVRLERLKKWCPACKSDKPWKGFWAAARWPDGTMQRPQYRCKECVKQALRQRRKDDPEWARDLNKREWQRIKEDPEKLAHRRRLTRENSVAMRRRRAEEDVRAAA